MDSGFPGEREVGRISWRRRVRWRGVMVVLGGILMHLTLGTLYTFGNLSPYLTSFMREYGSAPSLTYTQCAWIYALAAIGQGASVSVGGLLERKVGPKLCSLIGGWGMSLGVFLTYFSAKESFGLTILTYGAMFGFFVGLAYAVPLGCAMRWFPQRKGLVNGLVVAGFGGGAFIFDQVQTAFINPDNFKPDKEVDGEKYFDQASVLDRVPTVFLILGGCYSGMQLLAAPLMCNPPGYSSTQPQSQKKESVNHQEGEATTDDDIDSKSPLLDQPDKEEGGVFSSSVPATGDMEKQPSVEDVDDYTLSPRQVLKSRHFYCLWAMFLLNGMGSTFISTLYKAYGQTFIKDDTFLALVGSFAAVFNGAGRIFWGTIADKLSCRVAMLSMSAAFCALILTLSVTSYGGKPLFFIYVCLLFGSFSGSFSIFPTATAKCFGRKYLGVNYGLVFTSQILISPLGVFLSEKLKTLIGWNGLFFFVGAFSLTSFLLAMFAFTAKDKKGKEI
ncbi:uncharacterized MFS-type transporter YhjX [Aplysia californica]|uniref:Uncharacterized MFS-type transporter YhjX n=1 Tax=Aplysia californica TaxID=6500 RepID=A0ABM1A7F2_APLCA|nr:uncharacterized MFS-type transporter YhjX [Aplysia californica]